LSDAANNRPGLVLAQFLAEPALVRASDGRLPLKVAFVDGDDTPLNLETIYLLSGVGSFGKAPVRKRISFAVTFS
jgi:hypothetical protein